jgi:ribosomal protein L37AE/L43A
MVYEMGLFNWFDIEMKCPSCKKKSHFEFQTKMLGCTYCGYQKGDLLSDMYNYVPCYATCDNCGRSFDGDVMIKKGIVTGKVKNIKSQK